MAKRGATPEQKLDYEDREFTTIDGRTLVMGDYFTPEDFAVNDDNQAFILHESLIRVLFKLFRVISKKSKIEQAPKKDNEWCAAVNVEYVVESVAPDMEPLQYTWDAIADCKVSNAIPGFQQYTTTVAETRASGRVLRRILGVNFCTAEELAEQTIDIELDNSPIKPHVLMVLEKKWIGENGITMDQIKRITKKPELEKLDDLTSAEGAKLSQYLHRYQEKLIAENKELAEAAKAAKAEKKKVKEEA